MTAEKPKKSDEQDPKEKKGSKKLFVLIAIAAAVVLAGGGAAWFFLSHKADAKTAKRDTPKTAPIPKPAQYFPMSPPIVVNLNGGGEEGAQYLQVEIQLVTRDPEELKAITENAPAIRAHLLMLLSQIKAADVADLAGKQKLQKTALAEAQKVMTSETGKKCVEDLLFTSFVTQ